MKGEGGESALVVVLLSVFVLGGAGSRQLPGCEREGGESALVVVLLSVFVLGGAGGQSASGL